MQVDDDYIDELFARKLGDMEATPPGDGWRRIEAELNRRSRATRKFWLAAASFALVLSVTAAVVYIQTNASTGQYPEIAAIQNNTSQQQAETQRFSTNNDAAPQQQATVETRNSNRQLAEGKPETRNSKPETRNSEPETRNSQPATRNPQLETRNPKPETRNPKPETRNPKPETRNSKPETRNSKPETRNPKPETVYIDSWDELRRMQPVNTGRIGGISGKIAGLKLKYPEKQAEETVTAPSVPVYDDIQYVDVTAISSKPRQPRNRWELTGQFAPVYSYRAITGVPGGLRKSDFDDAESPLLAYSGGITVAYRVINRLSVQTGVFYSQMGQSVNNLMPVTNMYAAVSSNNSYNRNLVRTSSGSVTVASNLKADVDNTYASYFNAESQPATDNTMAVANTSIPSKYRMVERIDYLEIPLMLRYRIIDRKLSICVLGGMSANVLVSNSVFVDNGSELVKDGAVLMARPVNYSSALGLGIGYRFAKNLSVSIEPAFKYYLQSYTTSSQISSNPYAFGLFTGIVYCF